MADHTPNELADAIADFLATEPDDPQSVDDHAVDLLERSLVSLRRQGEQLDTLRAERDALLKAARAVAFCGGCGELPHDPNDECWYYDRSDCEYALRRGICSFDCHEEPSCMTDGPWPMEELRQLLAAAVPQDPERCACGKPATGTVGGVPTCGDDR